MVKKDYGRALTPREVEVVGAVLTGHVTSKDIGEHLAISERTARTHLATIYIKAGARNMTDLVLIALGAKESPIDMNIIWE